MIDTKWTPGPWRVTNNSHYWEIAPESTRNGEPMRIGDVCASMHGTKDGGEHVSGGEAEANAHLIAAAPDLYAGLDKAFSAIQAMDIDALGVVPETHDCPAFPIRDQLLHELSGIMRKARGES